ncbi:hypothetical protein GCM10009867_28440 [Pedococcus aerophilus]|uniref:Uncharacterized protein n=1 Tax=Pedococcus aerophilus TaxID=436356 RepID=A0ABN3UT21_9MICO
MDVDHAFQLETEPSTVTSPGFDSGANAKAFRVSPLSPAGRGAGEGDRVGVLGFGVVGAAVRVGVDGLGFAV